MHTPIGKIGRWQITTPLFVDYVMLWIMVEVAHFDPSDTGDDQITWTQSADGNYSAKSTYLMQCLVGALNPPFRRRFGMCGRRLGASSLCGSCFRIGCGQLIDCLPGNGYEYFYPLCYRNLETIKHLLLECQFSQRIWKEVSHCASLPSFDPLYWTPSWGVSKWFLTVAGLSGSAKYKGARSLTVLICWSLCKERNARIFQSQEKTLPRPL
jgi:hypothetical protein